MGRLRADHGGRDGGTEPRCCNVQRSRNYSGGPWRMQGVFDSGLRKGKPRHTGPDGEASS